MTVPYQMPKYGPFTGTVRSGEMVYGCGLRSKRQDFAQNLKNFRHQNVKIGVYRGGQIIWP
jgi:hypothetical protein